MSQKSWEARVPAFILEASEGLRALGRAEEAREPVKAQIARAARRAGLSYWRAFDLWYRKARRVQAAEIAAIRAARAARSRERRDEFACLASEFEALAERVSALAARPGGTDADALRALARRSRDLAEGE